MAEANYQVRPLRDEERTWLRDTLRARWGDDFFVGRGSVRLLDELHALVALDGQQRVGVATYALDRECAELVTLDALREGAGVGRMLIEAVAESVRGQGAAELLVMTTNDNLRALRLYQRAGFRLQALRVGAIEQARRLKPSIPQVGYDGIPIRDELDLVRSLARF